MPQGVLVQVQSRAPHKCALKRRTLAAFSGQVQSRAPKLQNLELFRPQGDFLLPSGARNISEKVSRFRRGAPAPAPPEKESFLKVITWGFWIKYPYLSVDYVKI